MIYYALILILGNVGETPNKPCNYIVKQLYNLQQERLERFKKFLSTNAIQRMPIKFEAETKSSVEITFHSSGL